MNARADHALTLAAAAHRRRMAAEMTSPHDRAMRSRMLENARFFLADARRGRIKAAAFSEAARIRAAADRLERGGEPILAAVLRNKARNVEQAGMACAF